ncbi:hypothetical protein niasHT_010679 [Heterodera trifolii]|uniref:Integrase catalytic domain-containing protein n=1 Tax=Heterodera trifolii TaxID=157864 RepID=A0ABD2LG46_9BILA
MLLVPEELYRSLLARSSAPVADASSARGGLPQHTTPIEHTAKRMARAAHSGGVTQSTDGVSPASKQQHLLNDDERLIHYQQEFKRFKKLLEDEQERPAPVRLTQLPTDEASKGLLRDALSEAARTIQQQQQPQPKQPAPHQQQQQSSHSDSSTMRQPPRRRQRPAKRPPRTTSASTDGAEASRFPSSSSAASLLTRTDNGGRGGAETTEREDSPNDDRPQNMAAVGPARKGQREADVQLHPSTSTATAAPAAAALRDTEQRKRQAIDYALRNAGTLGIGDGQQVYRLMQGAYRPIKNSDLDTLLTYHFAEPKPEKAPPGYTTFIGNARQDPRMVRMLFGNSGAESGKKKKKMGGGGEREIVVEQLLDPLYKDTRSVAAFTSVEPLLREAQRVHPERGIRRAEVRRYLARQRVYTLHRRAVRRFRRLPTLASGLHTDWQADLADFVSLRRMNRGNAYLLVCADTLSRQLFVEPVKSKKSVDMIRAFEHIFKRVGYVPWKLMTDQGKEFTAAPVQRFFNEKEVQHHCMHTSPQWHAGIAERAIRSIKERLYRYFTHRGTQCWTGVIQHLVSALNASPHRALSGLRPRDVNFANAEQIRRQQLESSKHVRRQNPRPPRFNAGDRVRIEKHKHVFKKGYLPRFTDEVFTVAEVRDSRTPTTYKLRDDNGELLTGWFYAQDLCLVLPPPAPPQHPTQQGAETPAAVDAAAAVVGPVYDIERVLKRRRQGRNGVEHCLVKWKGYSTAHNSWIPATSII